MKGYRFILRALDAWGERVGMEGVDLRTVQELMGHKTLAMTVRYTHLAPAHLHHAVRALDSPGQPALMKAACACRSTT